MDDLEVRVTQETKTFREVFVNGRSVGKREVNGDTATFLSAAAREHGIRTFTGTLNGVPVTNDMAHEAIPEGAVVGVQAKDSRGTGKAQPPPAPAPNAETEEKEYEEVKEPANTDDDAEEEKAS